MTGATVVASYEFANNLVARGMLDGSKTIAMNKDTARSLRPKTGGESRSLPKILVQTLRG
jgi:hypothetical protein